jgi:glycopeptide antibiotics resistance protein
MPTPLPETAHRVVSAVWGVYLLAVAWLVWNPVPSAPTTSVFWLSDLATGLGVDALTPDRAELLLNVVMLVPLSLIGGLLFPRLRVADWTTIGFLASLLIEVVQRLLLPTRTGSSRDVVANTLGALVGALLLGAALHGWAAWQHARHERHRRPA